MTKFLSKKRELLEIILRRRERLSDGSIWPRSQWDYTEWEEAFEELKTKLKEVPADDQIPF